MNTVSEKQMLECKMEQGDTNNEIKSNLSLLTKDQSNMAKQLDKIESIIKEWFSKIEDKFVTKETHKLTTDKVTIIYRIMWTVWWLVLARIIWALLKLI